MKPAPSVSVCVPTYNYARFLPDCIESVLQQEHSDLELIISDDASTDETEALVARYAARDERVRYHRNERRLGMNGNLRAAAGLARGTFVKMLCADDWLTPDCVSWFVGMMERHAAAVLATSACIVTDEGGQPLVVNFIFDEEESEISGESMISEMSLLRGSFGGNSSFFFRRDAYEAAGGYDGSLLYAGDLELGARLCRLGSYLHTNRPLFYGRDQPASSSSNDPAKLYDLKDYLTIPRKVFTGRAPFNREWFRFQAYTGLTTARYLVHAAVAVARRRPQLALAMLDLLARQGNLAVGLPLAGPHALARLVRRATGRHIPPSRPTEPWMGIPQRAGHGAGR